jgi:hypothetical protein
VEIVDIVNLFKSSFTGTLTMDVDWSGYGAQAVTFDGHLKMTRGAPVLRWAAQRIREDKALVEYLVWSNPSNLIYVSPALGADAEVAAAALASPFYAEKDPERPACCVLSCFSDSVCENKEVVLAALARSGYELEFAGEALRADPYVVAWAGAPVGAAPSRELGKTFMRLLKHGVSVEHVDANWRALSEDKDFCATRCGDYNLSKFLTTFTWHQLPLDGKHNIGAFLKTKLDARCPLCLRVAPPVRDMLWPTREEWDGVF